MLRTALAQMAGRRGQLLATGLAILIGAAFVTATLLASGLIRGTLTAAVSASYAGADVVVTGDGAPVQDRVLDVVAGVPGAAAAQGQRTAFVDVVSGGRTDFATAVGAPTDARLVAGAGLVGGALPTATGQVALREDLAVQLGASVGDALAVRWSLFDHSTEGGDPMSTQTQDVVVSGLLASRNDLVASVPRVLAWPQDVTTWSMLDVGGDPPAYDQVLVVAAAGVQPRDLRDAVTTALAEQDVRGVRARTAQEQADTSVDTATGTQGLVTGVLLSFAALAVLVAGVVVANTLAVLVAQRRRELALLRCVGATRRQLRDLVLSEAVVLGLVASLAGVVVGTGLAQAAASALSRADLGFTTPAAVAVTWASVLVPVAVGTSVTVLAALRPARAASRVTPVAALRPELPDARGRSGSRRRAALTSLLVLGGGLVLAAAVVLSVVSNPGTSTIALGVLGGGVSFLGVLVGAPLLLPPVLRALSWAGARTGGVPTRLAAVNALRNPRRSAVTASALLIGVTLVALFTVGTAAVQRTIEGELDRAYPVDITVGSGPAGGDVRPVADRAGAVPLDPAVMRAVDGVVAAGIVEEPLSVAATSAAPSILSGAQWPVLGLDPLAGAHVVRDPSQLDGLADGSVLVPRVYRGVVSDGDTLTLDGPAGSVDVTAVMTYLPVEAVIVTPADLARLDPAPVVSALWLDAPDGQDDQEALTAVTDAVGLAAADGPAVPVDGAAVQRGDVTTTLDAVLGVVLALLGVAVVIALVGVSNTLSLSVIERTRESALLRAMGLTRRQLRAMLGVEGVLLAAVGALVGVVLGTLYGWAGAVTVFGAQGLQLQLALPWEQLGVVVAVALLAGLAASVLPARRAVRTPPAAALAE